MAKITVKSICKCGHTTEHTVDESMLQAPGPKAQMEKHGHLVHICWDCLAKANNAVADGTAAQAEETYHEGGNH